MFGGHQSNKSINEYRYLKQYGKLWSVKRGRDGGAQWWPHPFTPITQNDKGVFPVCARDQNWQSWQDFSSYVLGRETESSLTTPAFIVSQFRKLAPRKKVNLLIGGNIASKGSFKGRIYDLYSMPEHWDKNKLERVEKVIDAGLEIKDRLSRALNKMFDKKTVGYDKNFVAGIKNTAMQHYISNAQQIVQQLLLDVDRKEARILRKEALAELKVEAKDVYQALMHKYQNDLPCLRRRKGEKILLAVNKVKT